jgi:hypothetical protein
VNRAVASLYRLFPTYEHSDTATPIIPPLLRAISGGYSSKSAAVRVPPRTFSTYNVRASVYRYVRPVYISDSTTKFTPKQTGQTLLENWQRKSGARSCYDCLLRGYISEDCTIDNEQAAALRVILEWLVTTHEAVFLKHDARYTVRFWYRTNGVDFGMHDANFLSLMTTAVNKAEIAFIKAGRPVVKRTVGRKTNPVNTVSSGDDSTLESQSLSSCYIDFSFKRVAG